MTTNSIFDLTGKVAIVTGGGRGLGRAMASGLSAAGANVMIGARTTDEIEETASAIRVSGGEAKAMGRPTAPHVRLSSRQRSRLSGA